MRHIDDAITLHFTAEEVPILCHYFKGKEKLLRFIVGFTMIDDDESISSPSDGTWPLSQICKDLQKICTLVSCLRARMSSFLYFIITLAVLFSKDTRFVCSVTPKTKLEPNFKFWP